MNPAPQIYGMLDRVPIDFDFEGKHYSGELSQVQGAGSSAVYHLMIDNYYHGRLRLSSFDNQWVFDGRFAELAEAFAMWMVFFEFCKMECANNPETFFANMLESDFTHFSKI